jgi:hypothetical protein
MGLSSEIVFALLACLLVGVNLFIVFLFVCCNYEPFRRVYDTDSSDSSSSSSSDSEGV